MGISVDLLWWYVYIIAAELFHWEYFKKPVSRKGLGHALSLWKKIARRLISYKNKPVDIPHICEFLTVLHKAGRRGRRKRDVGKE